MFGANEMICLKQNETLYDYDVRSLIGAFFANEKIALEEEETRFTFLIDFQENRTTAAIIENGVKAVEESLSCCYRDKENSKNEIKRLIYIVLSRYAKRELPWGNLTGVRPTKIAAALLEQGICADAVEEHFMKEYCTSRQKAHMNTKVAERELAILKAVEYRNSYSLYVGIPFCPSTCLYCSFTSYPIARYQDVTEDYLKALFREIEFAAEHYKDRRLLTIYMGGGTPTSLTADQMDRLIKKLKDSFDFSKVTEITIEAGRPDSITKEKLRVIYENGVSRISINPQTMNDETLHLIGRAHTAKQTIDAYELARKTGFTNINMDIIVGLPGEELPEIKRTLENIKKLSPDSLTVHSLAIKRAANLNLQMEKYKSLVKGSTNEMLTLVDQYASSMGLEPYYLYRQKNIPGNLENIGYARSGKECLYNILIMEEKQTIMALGAGASSKRVFEEENRIERAENVKDITNYITRIDEMIERKRLLL